MTDSFFLKEFIAQVRAIDTYGHWERMSDEELITRKFIKTKEQLKSIPIIADISKETTGDIRMILQALALGFEKKTGVMASVCFEMSHEGFGRGVVIANKVVIVDKYFKEAHRFGYASIEKLAEEGDKLLEKSLEIYEKFKSCVEA